MFEIALSIGAFSFCIYFLGLLGLLFKPLLIVFTIVYWAGFIAGQRQRIVSFINNVQKQTYSPLFLLSAGYLLLQAGINALGLLGPEIGFDAMWYHLTLPKLYLLYHSVIHFPGYVLYYSDMPKLTEMLYTVGLAFGSDVWARGIHFVFGILCCIVIYKVGRQFLSPVWAILACVLFYSQLVVGWESSSGYIDLSRTFFTVSTLFAFILWTKTQEKKWFVYSAILLGLTISTKLLALPDIATYAVAILFFEHKTVKLSERLRRVGTFAGISLFCLLPWATFAYIHTGNPVYPMFSSAYGVGGYWSIVNPIFLIQSIWGTFATASDPISPLFLAILPFIVLFGKRLWKEIPLLCMVAIGGVVAWYITPQTGGGRYILPYTPILALVSIYTIQKIPLLWKRVFIAFIVLVVLVSLGYRTLALGKLLPLLTGHETRARYIATHLQYNLGDFYDVDGYFAKHIKPTDTVLLFGFHNLYYVDFPFILSDWVKKGDSFDYVAVQGEGMPQRFEYWNLVYFNPTTRVRLYSFGGQQWRY